MNDVLWKSSIESMVDILPSFGIEIDSKASTLHNDGVPYEIAYAANCKQEHARIVIDPYPNFHATSQRERIHAHLSNGKLAGAVDGKTLEVIYSLGAGDHCKRYWLALGIDGSKTFEIYSALTGDRQNREQQLDSICAKLKIPKMILRSNFDLGPISISSNNNVLTVYLRPLTAQAASDFLPGDIERFLSIFGNKVIARRGLLIACKLHVEGLIGSKVDVCAHCVSPTQKEMESAGLRLGTEFLGKPFYLPESTAISFWGVSWGTDWSDGQRLHAYLRPAPVVLKNLQRYAAA